MNLSINLANQLAALAIECVQREYPNKIAHVMAGDSDVRPPHELTPAFYGCYDWHSAVHNHWLLVRLARFFPEAPFAAWAKEWLLRNLTAENILGELSYLTGDGRQNFERPYGLAWLLQLAQELDEWDEAIARNLARQLLPLERAAVDRLQAWLAKLEYPIRTGEHNQTAFPMALMIDYSGRKKNDSFSEFLTVSARKYYLHDTRWPFAYEPSGEDFLSPGLAEADLLRRVLTASDFSNWLNEFFPPEITLLSPAVSPDRSDPKFSHLDGLNLSRAWMLEGIASALPERDRRLEMFGQLAARHKDAGLAALQSEHYVGSHWLGTFAVYLLTRRGTAGPL